MFLTMSLMALVMSNITFSLSYNSTFFIKRAKSLQLFSVYGAGALLGATFAIILPESVSTVIDAALISNQGTIPSKTGLHIGLALTSGFLSMILF